MTEHTAKYEYNMTLTHWRVTCTCGWGYVGDRRWTAPTQLKICETKFSGHDLSDKRFVLARDPEWKQALRVIKGR